MKNKALEIVPGAYMIGGPGISSVDDCCVYLLKSKDESCIIDTGAGGSAAQILENVNSTGAVGKGIKYIIVTHGHIDHIGGLNYLRQALPDAEIVAHELDLPAIQDGRPELTAAAWYGVKYEGIPVDRILKRDISLPLGDIEINCVHTPGHTPGSISMYADVADQRILFAQDVHGPFLKEWGSDKRQWRVSMNILLDLRADILCEGHYGIYSPASQVKAYIEGYLQKF